MSTNTTALLVMDMQQGILSRLPEQRSQIIASVAEAIKQARQQQVTVIFVRLGFQNGFPEISPANKIFSGLKGSMSNNDLKLFMQLPEELGVTESDIVINKKRVSAFSGNELEMVLRAKGITHLALAGIATSGIVQATVSAAFDRDYQVTVLSDACADRDEEIHQFLLDKIFPKYAEVMRTEDWAAQTRKQQA
jgi:nicotinamidase-related amidase